jgi:hypothetical protein
MADHPECVWPAELAAAAVLLRRADEFAESLRRSPWDFAVELAELRQLGLSRADLRWLVCQGLVDHARELTRSRSQERTFQVTGKLTFAGRTCFILTPAGRSSILRRASISLPPPLAPSPPASSLVYHADLQPKLPAGSANPATTDGNHRALDASPNATDLESCKSARQPPLNHPQAADMQRANGNGHSNGASRLLAESHKPVWDKDLNRLTLGDLVVKEYKTPAPNQQLILSVFQEEGWPPRIDDPLPPHPDLEPKRRLHETIISLNRNQRNRVLQFCGDGQGEGVRWQCFQLFPRRTNA